VTEKANVETVKFVGGPKDGEEYPWTTARAVVIPDAKDMIQFIDEDGETGTLFGEHTYEMKCYAGPILSHWQLEYVCYKPPVLRAGMRKIGDGRAMFYG
jgi:hypothetical protein